VSPLVVITGSSRGIGRACALQLARRGASLALLGRPSEAQEQVRQACDELGATTHFHSCDLRSAAQIAEATSALLAALGPPAVVINNAAELQHGPHIHEIAIEDWDRIMAVNLRGPFLICRALLPAMLAAKRGRFIHIASISGTLGSPGMAHYCSSKWGLIGLNKTLAEELSGTNLSSVAVLPGSVDTDMLATTPFSPDMSAEQVAQVISYYALDAPNAVSGASVEVYG